MVKVAPGAVLILDKDWLAVAENRTVGRLTGEEKELIFLQAYSQVHRGFACWLDRWRAVTWGAGPEGTDERFKAGYLQPHMVSKRGRGKKPVASPAEVLEAAEPAAP